MASTGSMNDVRKDKVLAFIEANVSKDLSVWTLSNVAAMSRHHFCRSFRASVGSTPMNYVRQRRVVAAMGLLATSNAPISAIALDVGFSSQSHFTTAFKLISGTTPKAWRIESQQSASDKCPAGCPYNKN